LAAACAVFAVASLWNLSAPAVGTRHFVFDSAKDFEGELKGVAVDSVGSLRPGFALKPFPISEAPAVWAALEDGGGLLLATGNEGKLIRLTGGQSKVVADTEALALTSIARAWGRIFVGSMPGGKIFELKGDKLAPFVTLQGAEHVFALAFDEADKSLFAATGPEGKLFRITADGTSQVYFDSDQGHLVSVAADRGTVYTGSSGEGRLYKLTGPGRATVLRDFETTEVPAIAIGADGVVFAIANDLKGGGRSDAVTGTKPASPQTTTAQKGKGSLYRFSKGGLPEELYSEKDDHFVSLTLDAEGWPIVGTGSAGRVVAVRADHRSVVLADLDQRQVPFLLVRGGQGWLVGSDPVVAHKIEGLGGTEATFISKPLDAGLRARFGRVTWSGEGKVEIETRTGNTKEPDASWSDFSTGQSASFDVKSPEGRYLQVRVRMVGGPETALRRLEIPFVTDNLRAIVTELDPEFSRPKKGEFGLAKSGGPLEEKASTTVKLSWKVDNPDEDELRYRVEFRLLGTTTWFDVLEPGKVLTDEKWSWETKNLPEGKYQVRVTASDELSNPPARATHHSLESTEILVDNTAPAIVGLLSQGRRLTGKAKDGVGPIRRIEAQLVGGEEWFPFEPLDGIFDEPEEDFDVDVAAISPAGPALLTLRVFDTAGNFEVKHVRLAK
jgi:outer membrane protein assembly factor BamB